MTSLLKIAEQAKAILGKGTSQELIEYVKQGYALVAKQQWFEGKQDGTSEINGSFIYSFGKSTTLTPAVDSATDEYFIVLPSTYLELPHQFGVQQVSFLNGQNKPFINIGNGGMGLYSGLKAGAMGGNELYYVESTKMYFPRMTVNSTGNILLKLAVALDEVDVDENINIAPNVVRMIVDTVVQQYAAKEPKTPSNLT
jgi:hypothetical protein